jgi:hypothetical protein
MKLRIKGNSIRLRLLRSEVERLAVDGEVSESTVFGPAEVLRYTVKMDQNANSVIATFDRAEIAIALPVQLAKKWAASDDVSIEKIQTSGDGKSLEILIEKDFVCLDRRDDPDREDAFPNPNAVCV